MIVKAAPRRPTHVDVATGRVETELGKKVRANEQIEMWPSRPRSSAASHGLGINCLSTIVRQVSAHFTRSCDATLTGAGYDQSDAVPTVSVEQSS